MTFATPELVLPDTSCLIALTAADALPVLRDLYPRVVVPAAVAHEFGAPLPEWIEIVEIPTIARPLASALSSSIGRGETELIALAATRPGSLVVLDDRRARRVARDMGLRLTGTVGVLLRAKGEHLLGSVHRALVAAEAVGFRLSTELRQRALRLAEEDAPPGESPGG